MSSTVNNSFPTSVPPKLPPLYFKNVPNPVQNQWYTICDLKGNLQVGNVILLQGNDTLIGRLVDVEITIDGVVYTSTGNSVGNYTANNLNTFCVLLQEGNLDDTSTDPARVIALVSLGTFNSNNAQNFVFMSNQTFLRCSSFKYRVRLTESYGGVSFFKAVANVFLVS